MDELKQTSGTTAITITIPNRLPLSAWSEAFGEICGDCGSRLVKCDNGAKLYLCGCPLRRAGVSPGRPEGE